MQNVTGQKEVLELAGKIADLCREHTTSEIVAITATSVAGKVISATWQQLPEGPALSARVPAR